MIQTSAVQAQSRQTTTAGGDTGWYGRRCQKRPTGPVGRGPQRHHRSTVLASNNYSFIY